MRGRPSRTEEIAKNRIAARLTDSELDTLEKKRKIMDMSKSDFVREAILFYSEMIEKKAINV